MSYFKFLACNPNSLDYWVIIIILADHILFNPSFHRINHLNLFHFQYVRVGGRKTDDDQSDAEDIDDAESAQDDHEVDHQDTEAKG